MSSIARIQTAQPSPAHQGSTALLADLTPPQALPFTTSSTVAAQLRPDVDGSSKGTRRIPDVGDNTSNGHNRRAAPMVLSGIYMEPAA